MHTEARNFFWPAPVAQLDRAPDFESVGRRFESCRARHENIRRIGEMAKLFIEAGVIALTAFISPFKADREGVRALVSENDFIEIYCDSPLKVCEERDVKGLYKKARAGVIKNYTGVSSPYEPPEHPDLHLDTAGDTVETNTEKVIAFLKERHIFTR